MQQKKRSYSYELKSEAVKMVNEQGLSQEETALFACSLIAEAACRHVFALFLFHTLTDTAGALHSRAGRQKQAAAAESV